VARVNFKTAFWVLGTCKITKPRKLDFAKSQSITLPRACTGQRGEEKELTYLSHVTPKMTSVSDIHCGVLCGSIARKTRKQTQASVPWKWVWKCLGGACESA